MLGTSRLNEFENLCCGSHHQFPFEKLNCWLGFKFIAAQHRRQECSVEFVRVNVQAPQVGDLNDQPYLHTITGS